MRTRKGTERLDVDVPGVGRPYCWASLERSSIGGSVKEDWPLSIPICIESLAHRRKDGYVASCALYTITKGRSYLLLHDLVLQLLLLLKKLLEQVQLYLLLQEGLRYRLRRVRLRLH